MPHSLIALLLVASSSGRQHIVFAYPSAPQPLPRTSRPTYGKTFALADRRNTTDSDDDDASDADDELPTSGYNRMGQQNDELGDTQSTPPLFGENSWLSKPKASETEQTYEYLGLRGDLLADLLLPRHRGLYNKKLELVLNNLAFIGHPVWLDKPSPSTERGSFDSNRPTVSSRPSDSSSQVTSPGSQSSRGNEFSPNPFNPNERTTPDRLWTPTASTSSRDGREKPGVTVDRFSVTLVIDTPPDKQLSQQLDVYYRDIVVKLTAALKGEERRNGWLSSEVARCRSIRSEHTHKQGQVDVLTSQLISASPLCSALADVFDSISEGKAAHIEALNGSLDLSLLLHDELLDNRPLDGYRDLGLVEVYNPLRPVVPGIQVAVDKLTPQLAPWHALLPLVELDEMLEQLEPGPIADFVERISPKKPLSEYELELELDADSVHEIAHHLVYWRKVRVVSAVRASKQHAVHPSFDMRRLPCLSHDFTSRFSTLGPLPSLLANLPTSSTFRKALPSHSDRHTAHDALIWLLRNDVLIQLHTYLRIVATPSIRRAAARAAIARRQSSSAIISTPKAPLSTSETMTAAAGRSADETSLGRTPESFPGDEEEVDPEDREDRSSSVINEPARPSMVERRWLEQIFLGRDVEAVDHFQRMMPMMNGRFHLEAISHHTSLSLREIRQILDLFSDVVVRFLS